MSTGWWFPFQVPPGLIACRVSVFIIPSLSWPLRKHRSVVAPELALAFGDLSSSLLEYTLMSILHCHCRVIETRLMGFAAHLRPNVQLRPELVP
jgi:hypothetical protein